LPRLLLCYHFFHPDDVAGARQFAELAREQQRRGWEVAVLTSDRSWRDPRVRYPATEDWEGIRIHRVFRPGWDQARPLGRLANSGWLLGAFVVRALRLPPPDAVVIGSDPSFAPLAAFVVRAAFPSAALVHWCFDLYPEAIEAEGGGRAVGALAPAARALMGAAYRRLDAIVDLGPRMRQRLAAYPSDAHRETLVPWALVEPARSAAPDAAVRASLFPRARLGLLYSGTLGRAHDYAPFLALARACRARSGDAIALCFASRGHRHDELRRAVGPADTNVVFAPFADERELGLRLEAADLHLASLRPEWAGVVVPSKFFGSLAVGRPVIFAGPADSDIATAIAEHGVGMHLTDDTLPAVVDRLHTLAEHRADLRRWQDHTHAVYQRQFSRRAVNDRWDELLRGLVAAKAPGVP